jgi:hypothetical protein
MHDRTLPALSAVALFLTVAAAPAAENRLGIWPGMTIEEVAAALKPRCPDIVVEGADERSVICRIGGAGATVITATASSKGRTYYIDWREATDDEAVSYVRRIAGELGLRGPGKDCRFYDYELRCWYAKDGSVLYSGERDALKRYISYIVNDRIKEEDEGPATEAPVNRGE